MKSTGIIRKIDDLGRIVLPSELRKNLGIEIKDYLEIYVSGESIILKKFSPTCVFCGNNENTLNFKGKSICNNCLNQLPENTQNI